MIFHPRTHQALHTIAFPCENFIRPCFDGRGGLAKVQLRKPATVFSCVLSPKIGLCGGRGPSSSAAPLAVYPCFTGRCTETAKKRKRVAYAAPVWSRAGRVSRIRERGGPQTDGFKGRPVLREERDHNMHTIDMANSGLPINSNRRHVT